MKDFESDRLYLSSDIWKAISAMKTVTYYTLAVGTFIKEGIGDINLFMKETDGIVDQMKAVLPEYSEFLDANKMNGVFSLFGKLQEKIFQELKSFIEASGSEEETLAHTGKLIAMASTTYFPARQPDLPEQFKRATPAPFEDENAR